MSGTGRTLVARSLQGRCTTVHDDPEPMTTPLKTFIRATEIWVPSADGLLLEFGGGLFAGAAHFAAISRAMCFGRAEGLPGTAWDEGRPILLKQFEGSNFRRTAAAKSAGLGCAVALPMFLGDTLTAVLVFFCSDDAAQGGALELWRNNPRVTTDMTLVDGRYGADAAALEALSRETFLPRGTGLPGMAWQRGSAVFMPELGSAGRFLRGEAVASAGVHRGLAIPCPTRANENHVLTLLASAATPIARRIETWSPDTSGRTLQRSFGFCEGEGALTAATAGVPLEADASCVARAFMSGVPALTNQAAAEPRAVGASAGACGAETMVAVPIISEGVVAEVLALYF